MRIFLDSANVDELSDAFQTGLIDGVTTNPTLIKKSERDPVSVYRELEVLGVKDISMEVMGTELEMIEEALKLSEDFADIATIKIPMTQDGLKVCRYLKGYNIRTNVTLVFNAAQALLAAKAGATYVSPFVGRIDDQGYAGTEVVRSCVGLLARMDTQVLAASIRSTQRVVRCFYSGADIVTMPPSIFWKMYDHVLTDQGLVIFDTDANS